MNAYPSQLQPRKHFQAFGTTYAVQEGYSLHKELGQGAYGCVVAGKHEASGTKLAIKKLRGQTILTKRALREIKLLHHFRGHKNITCLYDMDIVDYSNFNEVYLYEELMEADLHAIIRSGQPLTDQHYQSFVYQTLCGLKYIHSADVIHRDLKPGNLLICDFGLARGFESDPLRAGLAGSAGFMTEYVATRWYRAPEIMLSFANYSTSIDIWSVGCILAELLGGRPIFKGRDYVDQLNQILHVLGTPSEETLRRVGSPRAVEYIRSLPIKPRIPFERIYPKANPLALDLLSKMLTFDPAKRITCDEALKHPYLAVWHDPTDEPSCPERFDFGFEVEDSLEGMKSAIVEEVKSFRKKVRTPVNVQQQQQAEQQRLMEEQAAAHIQAKEAKESLPVPSREELSGNETPKDELTSSYTIPPQANANDGSYVLDDPSEELERELASTKI
ncbi:kinase-like protein [Wallemia mellicola CBS 633.66]|uniref:mitogen-activated protein kinase n=1 Tax=Wallemia mellicola (strain ATCC MYA-4683 / CBS 633.66) TaxID=671144 RepID=I4Y7D4_WALMC|nr:kinase-like protein [Wallemia mellicola CBS 633.66]EIM19876.1 kinase-like protein [Wallemia mellicola CBS 633.66]|eukprot:XP_006960018.1 kinase-like protein [Wallemia mellicola CBS 633.66]